MNVWVNCPQRAVFNHSVPLNVLSGLWEVVLSALFCIRLNATFLLDMFTVTTLQCTFVIEYFSPFCH